MSRTCFSAFTLTDGRALVSSAPSASARQTAD
jgi:hypothetical protein